MKMKRYLCLLLVSVWFLFAFPVSAFANGPGPTLWYEVILTNLPENTAYVDLLIPMEREDPVYTELEEGNLPDGFSADAEIVRYHEEGFCSYTFHYRDARSLIAVDRNNSVSFFTSDVDVYDESRHRYSHMEDVDRRGEIRLALLDAQGNIIHLSSRLRVNPTKPFAYRYGAFRYDAQSDQWEMSVSDGSAGMILYFFISLTGLVVTCLVEGLIAWPFGLGKKYGRMIRWTNAISQIAMRLADILLYMLLLWHHTWTVIGLEGLVYTGEYLFYRKRMKDVPWKRVLAYTVAANTASLVCGHFLNLWVLF